MVAQQALELELRLCLSVALWAPKSSFLPKTVTSAARSMVTRLPSGLIQPACRAAFQRFSPRLSGSLRLYWPVGSQTKG